MKRNRLFQCVAVLAAVAILGGCAAKKSYSAGQREMRRENYDKAVLAYSKAVASDPGNTRFSVALERAKLQAANYHFSRGQRFARAGQVDQAVAEFQQTLLLNSGHQHAATELQRAIREIRRREAMPSEIEQMKERARRRDMGPPKLDPRSNIAIQMNFDDQEIGKIFEAISKVSGINFIFDDKVDLDKPMTIDLGNVTLEKALDILMLQTKNFYKPIDDYTLLVAPDSRQKRQEYEDQVIRTFFLSNADTKQVVTLLRSLLQSRQIAENPDLNSVTIKDTPDKAAIAERIIRANDKSKGEVLIDVELLEINRTITKTLGIDLSSKTLSLTFRDGQAGVPLNNLDVVNQGGNWTLGVIPSVVLDFFKSDSDTKTIAKPQLRVSEGEQAEILIGDRVPIPTTSFNTSQTIGGNIVPITSFTYQNVGIQLQIEPRVHHNKEVTLKVQVEVSQISGSVESANGTAQPIIGTRQIQTVIRLRDGETNMLAGLIQRSNSDGRSGVPGVMDTPGLGRFFSRSSIEDRETDIILTLTPRIVRIPDITEDDLATLWVGTEENMQLRGPARNALDQSPFSLPEALRDGGSDDAPTLPPMRPGSLARIDGGSSESPSGAAPGASGAAAGGGADSATPRGDGGDSTSGDQSNSQGGTRVGRTTRVVPSADDSDSAAPPPADPRATFDPDADDSVADPFDDQADEDDGGLGREDPSVGPAMVRLIPSRATYNVGEPVVLNVFIENAQNVGSIPFHLRYDPNVLQFVSPAQEGPFLGGDGTSTVFLASDTGGGGQVVVGLSRMGGDQGISGAGSLCTFQFLAIAPGNAGFAFTGASVKDPQTRNLPANFSTVAVTVE